LESDFGLANKPAFYELVIATCVFQNLMSGRAQELFFALKDFIFSSREAVVIVHEQYLHMA
jgi:Cft2 family RNA processing exonuclease